MRSPAAVRAGSSPAAPEARSPFLGAPFLARFLREKWVFFTDRTIPPNAQCAGTDSSVVRPAGGTTTVVKLPSTVSF